MVQDWQQGSGKRCTTVSVQMDEACAKWNINGQAAFFYNRHAARPAIPHVDAPTRQPGPDRGREVLLRSDQDRLGTPPSKTAYLDGSRRSARQCSSVRPHRRT